MALEDRGVKQQAFIDLQNKAKETIFTAGDSLGRFVDLLKAQGLGYKYHLEFIMSHLFRLGLDWKGSLAKKKLDNPFLERLMQCATQDSLRTMKHRARIPVPESYQLVGVADEGKAYIEEGKKNVLTLEEGTIFGEERALTML